MEAQPPDFFTGKTKEYWDFLYKYIKPKAEKILTDPKYKSDIEESLYSTLSGKAFKTINGVEHDQIDLFINNILFRPFSEISNSYESLSNIRTYINSFPFRRSDVSKVAYLRYHIENYLNEIYLLKERLVSYLTKIKRAYKSSPAFQKLYKIVRLLDKTVVKSLEPYVIIRGAHVHEYRYDDDDIGRLSTFDLLMKGADDDFTTKISILFEMAYKEIRKKWRKKICEDLINLHKLMDLYFEYLLAILQTNSELMLPAFKRK